MCVFEPEPDIERRRFMDQRQPSGYATGYQGDDDDTLRAWLNAQKTAVNMPSVRSLCRNAEDCSADTKKRIDRVTATAWHDLVDTIVQSFTTVTCNPNNDLLLVRWAQRFDADVIARLTVVGASLAHPLPTVSITCSGEGHTKRKTDLSVIAYDALIKGSYLVYAIKTTRSIFFQTGIVVLEEAGGQQLLNFQRLVFDFDVLDKSLKELRRGDERALPAFEFRDDLLDRIEEFVRVQFNDERQSAAWNLKRRPVVSFTSRPERLNFHAYVDVHVDGISKLLFFTRFADEFANDYFQIDYPAAVSVPFARQHRPLRRRPATPSSPDGRPRHHYISAASDGRLLYDYDSRDETKYAERNARPPPNVEVESWRTFMKLSFLDLSRFRQTFVTFFDETEEATALGDHSCPTGSDAGNSGVVEQFADGARVIELITKRNRLLVNRRAITTVAVDADVDADAAVVLPVVRRPCLWNYMDREPDRTIVRCSIGRRTWSIDCYELYALYKLGAHVDNVDYGSRDDAHADANDSAALDYLGAYGTDDSNVVGNAVEVPHEFYEITNGLTTIVETLEEASDGTVQRLSRLTKEFMRANIRREKDQSSASVDPATIVRHTPRVVASSARHRVHFTDYKTFPYTPGQRALLLQIENRDGTSAIWDDMDNRPVTITDTLYNYLLSRDKCYPLLLYILLRRIVEDDGGVDDVCHADAVACLKYIARKSSSDKTKRGTAASSTERSTGGRTAAMAGDGRANRGRPAAVDEPSQVILNSLHSKSKRWLWQVLEICLNCGAVSSTLSLLYRLEYFQSLESYIVMLLYRFPDLTEHAKYVLTQWAFVKPDPCNYLTNGFYGEDLCYVLLQKYGDKTVGGGRKTFPFEEVALSTLYLEFYSVYCDVVDDDKNSALLITFFLRYVVSMRYMANRNYVLFYGRAVTVVSESNVSKQFYGHVPQGTPVYSPEDAEYSYCTFHKGIGLFNPMFNVYEFAAPSTKSLVCFDKIPNVDYGLTAHTRYPRFQRKTFNLLAKTYHFIKACRQNVLSALILCPIVPRSVLDSYLRQSDVPAVVSDYNPVGEYEEKQFVVILNDFSKILRNPESTYVDHDRHFLHSTWSDRDILAKLFGTPSSSSAATPKPADETDPYPYLNTLVRLLLVTFDRLRSKCNYNMLNFVTFIQIFCGKLAHQQIGAVEFDASSANDGPFGQPSVRPTRPAAATAAERPPGGAGLDDGSGLPPVLRETGGPDSAEFVAMVERDEYVHEMYSSNTDVATYFMKVLRVSLAMRKDTIERRRHEFLNVGGTSGVSSTAAPATPTTAGNAGFTGEDTPWTISEDIPYEVREHDTPLSVTVALSFLTTSLKFYDHAPPGNDADPNDTGSPPPVKKRKGPASDSSTADERGDGGRRVFDRRVRRALSEIPDPTVTQSPLVLQFCVLFASWIIRMGPYHPYNETDLFRWINDYRNELYAELVALVSATIGPLLRFEGVQDFKNLLAAYDRNTRIVYDRARCFDFDLRLTDIDIDYLSRPDDDDEDDDGDNDLERVNDRKMCEIYYDSVVEVMCVLMMSSEMNFDTLLDILKLVFSLNVKGNLSRKCVLIHGISKSYKTRFAELLSGLATTSTNNFLATISIAKPPAQDFDAMVMPAAHNTLLVVDDAAVVNGARLKTMSNYTLIANREIKSSEICNVRIAAKLLITTNPEHSMDYAAMLRLMLFKRTFQYLPLAQTDRSVYRGTAADIQEPVAVNMIGAMLLCYRFPDWQMTHKQLGLHLLQKYLYPFFFYKPIKPMSSYESKTMQREFQRYLDNNYPISSFLSSFVINASDGFISDREFYQLTLMWWQQMAKKFRGSDFDHKRLLDELKNTLNVYRSASNNGYNMTILQR